MKESINSKNDTKLNSHEWDKLEKAISPSKKEITPGMSALMSSGSKVKSGDDI